MRTKVVSISLFFSLLLMPQAYSQEETWADVEFRKIAEGTDSPIQELQIVCLTKFFNKDYLSPQFREKYNLDEKTLYKKKMLIEIFHSDTNKKGLDKIELIEIKENDKEFVIAYNLVNSDTENDDTQLSPFLIVQVPRTKKQVKFIKNGVELGKTSKLYLD